MPHLAMGVGGNDAVWYSRVTVRTAILWREPWLEVQTCKQRKMGRNVPTQNEKENPFSNLKVSAFQIVFKGKLKTQWGNNCSQTHRCVLFPWRNPSFHFFALNAVCGAVEASLQVHPLGSFHRRSISHDCFSSLKREASGLITLSYAVAPLVF